MKSKIQHIKVSKFRKFKLSKLQISKVSKIENVKVSESKSSKFQISKESIKCVLEEIDPMLQNSHFMFLEDTDHVFKIFGKIFDRSSGFAGPGFSDLFELSTFPKL